MGVVRDFFWILLHAVHHRERGLEVVGNVITVIHAL